MDGFSYRCLFYHNSYSVSSVLFVFGSKAVGGCEIEP